MSLRRAVGLIGVTISLFAGLWAAPVSAAPARQGNSPLSIAMPEPATLDPVQLSRFDLATRDLVENLFVGMTRFDPATRQAEPMLAKSWTTSDDGLKWTFELRDDIQWVRIDPTTQEVSTVRPVVAGDFVYAIQRACDPLRPSPVTTNLMVVKGCLTIANAFPQTINDLFMARIMGARATSPTTLEIELAFPAAYLPILMSTPEFRPLAREAVSDTTNWTMPQTMVSNGPYVLTSWTSAGMTLARNPFWPDPYAGNVEQVAVTFTTSGTAATLAASGQIDMARVTSEEVAAAHSTAPQLLKVGEGGSLTMIGFSFDRNMVSVPSVRRALAMAIDRDALISQFFPDQALAANRLSPAGIADAPTFDSPLFNPAQAQADYSAAGYPACGGVTEKMILLVPDDDPIWVELGQAIIQQWSTNLGCNPSLFEVQTLSRTLLIDLAHATYDTEKITRSHMWLTTWSADYPDANAWTTDVLHCHYGYVRTERDCDQADAWMDQSASQMDPDKRAEFYTQIEQSFFGSTGSFPVIPLYRSTAAWLQQAWLTGVNEVGAARFDLWTLGTPAS
jgi:ABC-type oligopeptide transport system substrate-binding subunit